MKVYARWIKATPIDHSPEEYYFRKNTVLQFGNSWDIIGAAILINPGSALPTDEMIDYKTKTKLQEISNQGLDKDKWRVFKPDSTMRFLEKIFSGWYIAQWRPLNGVILLYNLFNIRCANLNEALRLRKSPRFEGMENEMVTKAKDLTPLNVPIYIGWGNTGKTVLASDAKELFRSVCNRVKYYTGEDFSKALFYHPLYVNTSYRKDICLDLLHRFLDVESNGRHLLTINREVGCDVIEHLKTLMDADKIIESSANKLAFRPCNENLTFAVVSQKSKQYIYCQHTKYDKRKNYRDFLSEYEYSLEIRDILESFDYNRANDSTLGEKYLKDFAAMDVKDISKMIWGEIQEISEKINALYE